MTGARPTSILAPPLLALALAAAIQGWNLAGIQAHLSAGLFAVWQANVPHTAGLRPSQALAGETLLLLASGGIVTALATRVRLYWAGLFAAVSIVAAFEMAWFLFRSRHWLIDAATPALGLAMIFSICAVCDVLWNLERRTRLRIAFCDSLNPATLRMLARRPELFRTDGERRMVTCLVCGMRDTGALTAQQQDDPARFVGRMDATLSALLDQVRRHGGILDRIGADGFAAFWNAPLDDPDHARHACEAARAIVAVANKQNPSLELGIGIASGAVIAGLLDGRRYGLCGGAMAQAAQLEALASRYGSTAMVAEETRTLAQQAFAFLEVDQLAAGERSTRLYALIGNPAAGASPKFRALSTFHDHIFQALRHQQWGEARGLIAQCRNLSGASPTLYDLYLARVRHLESNPPGPGWDGVYRSAS